MKVGTKLVLIAVGYGLAVAGGIAAVTVNELLIPADIQQTSGGMVAFGDMILFVLATGFLSLLPTWFLLKLWVEKAPRSLLSTELLIAAMGPISWLVVIWIGAVGSNLRSQAPSLFLEMLGPLIAFAAIPRIVFGPVQLMIEGVTIFMFREGTARKLLAGAMLLDLVPMSIYAMRMTAGLFR